MKRFISKRWARQEAQWRSIIKSIQKKKQLIQDYERKRVKTPPKKDTPVTTSSNVLIKEVSSKPLKKRRLIRAVFSQVSGSVLQQEPSSDDFDSLDMSRFFDIDVARYEARRVSSPRVANTWKEMFRNIRLYDYIH